METCIFSSSKALSMQCDVLHAFGLTQPYEMVPTSMNSFFDYYFLVFSNARVRGCGLLRILLHLHLADLDLKFLCHAACFAMLSCDFSHFSFVGGLAWMLVMCLFRSVSHPQSLFLLVFSRSFLEAHSDCPACSSGLSLRLSHSFLGALSASHSLTLRHCASVDCGVYQPSWAGSTTPLPPQPSPHPTSTSPYILLIIQLDHCFPK